MLLRFGILTVSDRSAWGERPDLSGPALAKLVMGQGWNVVCMAILADDLETLSEALSAWTDGGEVDVILTNGGVGFSPRDITPEATRRVIERDAPDLAEVMRAASLKVTPHAVLPRVMAGIRGKTLIVNLPGDPKAAVDNFQVILPALPREIELLHDEAEAGKDY